MYDIKRRKKIDISTFEYNQTIQNSIKLLRYVKNNL